MKTCSVSDVDEIFYIKYGRVMSMLGIYLNEEGLGLVENDSESKC